MSGQTPSTGDFGIFSVTLFEIVDKPLEFPACTPNAYVTPGRKPERVALPLLDPSTYAVIESGVDVTV